MPVGRAGPADGAWSVMRTRFTIGDASGPKTRADRGSANAVLGFAAAGALALMVCATTVQAADLSEIRRVPVLATSGISAELFAGRLSGQSRELVYNVPGDRSKLGQLNWQIDSAAVIGGALDYPIPHGFALKARGWVHASSDNRLDDFDWLSELSGFRSWTDLSHYNDTRIAKAFQLDLGAPPGCSRPVRSQSRPRWVTASRR